MIITGVLRNITQNFVTPSEAFNASLVTVMITRLTPIDPAMQKFNLEWGWNHEDLAGNPIHLLLVGFTIALLILLRRKFKTKEVWPYLGIILLSYLFLGIIVRYDLYGNRYQLPFFLAFAPLVGITFETTSRHKIVLLLSFLLLLSAFPWVLFNRTRPLIAMRESNDPYTIPCLAGCTAGSILNEPPEKTMFAVWGSLGSSYVDAMKQVEATGCRDIGLKTELQRFGVCVLVVAGRSTEWHTARKHRHLPGIGAVPRSQLQAVCRHLHHMWKRYGHIEWSRLDR